MSEVWLDVPEWNGYQVSSLGNVRSFKRNKEGQLLKPRITKKGYLVVHFRDNGRSKLFQCHRLVLMTFNPIPNCEDMEVNHKNENKQDNRLENLEWMSHLDNVRYGTGIQRKALIQSRKVLCVELNLIFDSMRIASESMGVNYGNISSCCNGRVPKAGGYTWQFVN